MKVKCGKRQKKFMMALAMKAAGLLIAVFLPLLLFTSCAEKGEPQTAGLSGDPVSTGDGSYMGITFFDAGKADCILLRTPDSVTMIDSGTNKFGKELVSSLSDMGIDHIDNLFITHFDKDHVGGADKLLKHLDVGAVYEPDYVSDSKQYRQYREALDAGTAELHTLKENTSFVLDGASYSIDVADDPVLYSDDENDLSLVISVSYGDTSFLFAGDAENYRLAELIEADIGHHDVLKVPHHGRGEKLSADFFAAVSPEYAVITSSDDEREEAEVVAALEELGTRIYLTRYGTVTCTTDGKTISFNQ